MTGSNWTRDPEPATPCLVQRALDESALREMARRVADHLAPPLVLYLEGDLGAGKTTFVRSLLRALGYPGPVKSPTYGLMELYDLPRSDSAHDAKSQRDPALRVLHLDLYRIADAGELEYLGLGDLLIHFLAPLGRSLLSLELDALLGGLGFGGLVRLALEQAEIAQ